MTTSAHSAAPLTACNGETIDGPFGPARFVTAMNTAMLAARYVEKCGVDVARSFHGHSEIQLYECQRTGMGFWRPEEIAGDEQFYHALSGAWPNYYRDWRWEYGKLDSLLTSGTRAIEIGCGRGYFLRHLEGRVDHAEGLEFNTKAIANKVTRWAVHPETIEQAAGRAGGSFDLVCHFQVLEHVTDPDQFLQSCLRLLKPGGFLAFSVPDNEYVVHANHLDPFDLPPHHVNQFTQASLRRIAQCLGLEMMRVESMPRAWGGEDVTQRTAGHWSYRHLRRVAERLFNLAYRLTAEPGHTLLAVMRKPGGR